jgi:hypothetical protein
MTSVAIILNKACNKWRIYILTLGFVMSFLWSGVLAWLAVRLIYFL